MASTLCFINFVFSETFNTPISMSYKTAFHVSFRNNITCSHNKQHRMYVEAMNSWADEYTPWEASETKK